jgi:DNA-binding NarL/FixJ family response regulator
MRVLVLEPDVLVARGLSRLLGLLGHEARCPPTAAEARAALEADPAVDLILAAQHLEPGAQGTEFLRWAAARVPSARRVLMSAFPCPPDFIEQPGIQLFRSKPFGRVELEALLTRDEPTPRSHP